MLRYVCASHVVKCLYNSCKKGTHTMANTLTITDFAMYLVRVNRAKDATTAGKRVRSALRAHKSEMAKVDANIKKHQKGASYMPLNNASATILANALNVKVSDISRKPASKKRVAKNVKKPVTSDAS